MLRFPVFHSDPSQQEKLLFGRINPFSAERLGIQYPAHGVVYDKVKAARYSVLGMACRVRHFKFSSTHTTYIDSVENSVLTFSDV